MAKGNGNGTFASPIVIGLTQGTIWSIAVGDVNGDGSPDVAYSARLGTSVSLVTNNGTGTFSAPEPFDMNVTVVTIALADMNNDTKLDLVAFARTPAVSMRMNSGTGFANAVSYTAGTNSSDGVFAVGDISGDAIPDVVATTGSQIAVLINDGTGVLGTPTTYAMLETANLVAIADVDADGDGDVLAVSGTTLSVRLNEGGGAFGARDDNPVGTDTVVLALALGDVNGDGSLDALVGGNNQGASLTLLYGSADGSFGVAMPLRDAIFSQAVALEDVNGDGADDVLVATPYVVTTYLNVDNAVPVELPRMFEYDPRRTIVAGRLLDANGDTRPDLVTIDYNRVSTRLATADGTFESSTQDVDLPGAAYQLATVADIDRNGIRDLIAVASSHGDGLLNGGADLVPQAPFALTTSFPDEIASGDMDGDGAADLFVSTDEATIEYLHANGDGTFGASTPVLGLTTDQIRGVAVGDVDGDGHRDLVVSYVSSSSKHLALFRGTTGGTLALPIVTDVNHFGTITLHDLNRDGVLDLVDHYSKVVQLGDGAGGFTSEIPFPLASNEVAFGDVDGDGNLDVLGAAGGFVAFAHGNGDGTFDQPAFYEPLTATRSIAVSDVDGDGHLDVTVTGDKRANVLYGRCLP